jgi:TAP-like protein
MIGVNPPGHFLWDAKTTGEQEQRYAALCAKDASCRGRTPDLAASLHAAYDHVPSRFLFLPIKQGNVRAAAFFGLFNETADGGGPLAAPKTIDTLLAAQQGDGSGAWLTSLLAQLIFPRAQVWGDVAAVARTDAAYARRFYASHADRGSVIGSPGTDLIWAGGRLVHAWPASPDENEFSHVRDSNVETLLIGGSLDFSTPPQDAARELLPHLPNGHQVVLQNLGHTDDFWAYEPEAATRLINTFLDSGRVRHKHLHEERRRLHAEREQRRDREDRARRDARARRAGCAHAGLDAAPPAAARRLRAQGEHRPPLALRARARAGRLVRRRADRAHGAAGRAGPGRDAGARLDRDPRRARDLLRLIAGNRAPRLDRRRRGARSVARLHVTSGGLGLTAPLFAIVRATAGANLIVLVLDILRDSEVAVRRGVFLRHVPGHSA